MIIKAGGFSHYCCSKNNSIKLKTQVMCNHNRFLRKSNIKGRELFMLNVKIVPTHGGKDGNFVF